MKESNSILEDFRSLSYRYEDQVSYRQGASAFVDYNDEFLDTTEKSNFHLQEIQFVLESIYFCANIFK